MARLRYFLMAFFLFYSVQADATQSSNPSDYPVAKIQQLTGQPVHYNSNDRSVKMIVPRDDLTIQMSGIQLPANRGLSSSITFKKIDHQSSMSGDLVLLQDQVNPVISTALKNGLEVTSLNNPFLWDSPRVMVLHVKGEGDLLQLAGAVGKVFNTIKATSNGDGDFPLGDISFPQTTLNNHKINALLGVKGQFINDVYQVQFSDGVKKTDTEMNKTIAVNTWAAFAGSDNEAVMTGTIATRQSELQKVLMTLRNARIYILAIYHYSLDDDTELVSIRFWGIGTTQTLAKSLHATFAMTQKEDDSPTKIENTAMADNANKGIQIIPISSSFVQNNYCSYANALRSSAATSLAEVKPQPVLVKPDPKAAMREAAALMALRHLVDKISRPSASIMLSRLSVVRHNKPVITLILHPVINQSMLQKTPPMVIKPMVAKMGVMQDFIGIPATRIFLKLSQWEKDQLHKVAPSSLPIKIGSQPTPKSNPVMTRLTTKASVLSARLMLSQFSTIQHHRWAVNQVVHSMNKNPVARMSSTPSFFSQLAQAKIGLIRDIKTHATVEPAKILKPVKMIQSVAVLSAKQMLSRLSVIKNHVLGKDYLARSFGQKQLTVARVSPKLSIPNPVALKTVHRELYISARAILSKLSVVKDHPLVVASLPKRSIPNHMAVKAVHRELFISARAILSKLPVVKDHPLMVVLLPKHPSVG